MTMLTKQEIEALLDGTTPGPWELDGVRPHTAHVWPVDGCDDPITGEIDIDNAHLIAAAPVLARTALDALARLEDAEAALALAVEGAAGEAAGEVAAHGEAHLAPFVRRRIRALAPASGVEALAALRAKIGDLGRQVRDLTRRAVDAESDRDQQLHVALQYEAERDDALARLAAAEGRVAALTEAAKRAERALRPFADCCFNDNGDVTVADTHTLTGADFMNAYQALGKITATVTPPADTGEGGV